jgi:CheY-like chemotaxis protein
MTRMTESLNIPDEFIEQVKQALEHLYDFPYLQRQPLAQHIASADSEEPAGHILRRELVSAIESLNPGSMVSVRSGVARLYNLIHLHYVGSMTLQETALELGLSLRQAYRDLRRGQETIAEILWLKYPPSTPKTNTFSVLQSEVAHLETETRSAEIHNLIQVALKAVEKLAERQSIQLVAQLQTTHLVTNSVIAQQAFISLLSQTLQQTTQDTLHITLTNQPENMTLTLHYAQHTTPNLDNEMLLGLLKQLKWSVQAHADKVVIHLRAIGTTLLVVDDNEGIASLFERFLTSYPYQLVFAHNGQDGIQIASQLKPDAIILDLMMPGMDGWELLQRLRLIPEMQTTPMIVCSVINDPELAYSLGASEVLAKPLTQESLLSLLQKLSL